MSQPDSITQDQSKAGDLSRQKGADRTAPIGILIVDDRVDKRTALRACLERQGYDLHEAASGIEALKLLLGKSYAVVVLDVNMPGMDGFETGRMIRQKPSLEFLPIIFVSAADTSDTQLEEAFSLGAVDYITSPINPTILRARVGLFVSLFERNRALHNTNETLESKVVERTSELANSQQQLRWLIENTTETVWRFDLRRPVATKLPPEKQIDLFYEQGFLAECNEAMAKVFGFERADQMLGMRLDTLLPRDKPLNLAYLTAFIGSNYRLIDAESTENTRDGQTRHMLNNLVGVVENGLLVRAWGTSRDISERKRAQHALSQSEARFRRMYDSNLIGIAFWNVKGLVIDANEAYLRITGYTREELKSAGAISWRDLTPEEYRTADNLAIEQAVTRGSSDVYEKEYVRRDGTRVAILQGVAFLSDSKQEGVAFVLDINERKRAERAVRESENRFHVLADTAPVLIWMSGLDQKCFYFNRRWLEFTGRTADDECAEGWHNAIHPEDIQRCLTTYHQAFEARREFVSEYRLRRADGNYRWILDHGVPRFTENGEFLGYIGSCIDFTERRETEERMRKLNQELDQRVQERTAALRDTNQQMETFIYTVAHDLRAPLRSMRGFSEALVEDYAEKLDDTGKDFLLRIRRSAAHMDKLLQDLLDYSRLSRAEIVLEPIDLDLLFQIVVQMHQDVGRTRNAQVTTISGGLKVLGHSATLETALSNLVANALKFVAPGTEPRVSLTASDAGNEVLIQVADNGIGIAPEYHEKIFRMFERLHSSQKEFTGTGIGLAIALRAVERMNGKISVESKLGEGSRFSIRLPKAETSETVPAESLAQ